MEGYATMQDKIYNLVTLSSAIYKNEQIKSKNRPKMLCLLIFDTYWLPIDRHR